MINAKMLKEVSAGQRILYVEDQKEVRDMFLKFLDNFFKDIVVATNGEEGLALYEEHQDFDMVISDIQMPKLDGMEMVEEIKKINENQSIIFVTAFNFENYLMRAIKLNIDGYIIKPIEPMQVIEVLYKSAKKVKEEKELIKYQDHLQELVTLKTKEIVFLNQEIDDTLKEVLFTLGGMAEVRSKETGNHVQRVAKFSKVIANGYGLNKDEVEILKNASAMHDVGKIAIPDNILNKPGKLTPDEFALMKKHTDYGYEMLKGSDREFFKKAAIVAYTHHEKFDGSGYPNGLKGKDIHIYGRITAIADVFDALGSDRIYKKAWELDRVLELLKSEKNKHFDGELIDIFFKNLDEILAIKEEFKDIYSE